MSRYNDILMHTVICLLALGIIMVYSASINPFSVHLSGLPVLVSQVTWLFVGFLALFISSHINHRKLLVLSKLILIFSMIIVVLGYFTSIGSTTARWVHIFGRSLFQTSELAKIAIIIFTASFIENNKRKITDWRFMLKNYYPYLGISIILIFFQPDLSSAFVISLIALSMLFVAGLDKKQIKTVILLALFMFMMKFLIMPFLTGESNFQNARFSGFLSGQVPQQQYAIESMSSGGVLGIGLGESKWKTEYVAEPQTDFIFSVVTSELGAIGSIILFGGFFLIFIRGMSIVKKSTDIFGMFIALGITLNLILYFIIHVGYNVGLLPTTGLPMPFVSYGGSHTIFNLFQIGLLLSISYRMRNVKS